MNRLRSAALCLCFLLSIASLTATSVRMVNLFEMTKLADRVFWGKCRSVEPQAARAGLPPAVEYVFEVRRGIKGVERGETVVFRQIQAARPGVSGIPGVPHYREGDEVLLFLHQDSRWGLTSPVGLDQGVFKVERSRSGEIGFINGLKNGNLRHALSQEQVNQSGLSAGDRSELEKKAPIAIDRFMGLLEKVRHYQDSRRKSDR